jgi:hypothetical protein
MVVMRANIDLNRCDVEQHGISVFDVQSQTSQGFVSSTRDDLKALPQPHGVQTH